jgi:thiamine biosynthesis lipoprotein ApbE
VLDPRVGKPVGNGAALAAVALSSATETDALSTALLVVGAEGHDSIFGLRPRMKTLLLLETEGGYRCETRGLFGGQMPGDPALGNNSRQEVR